MKTIYLFFLILFCSTNLFAQVVNVADYGATPNNSADDDRSAIVNAIAACASLGSPTLLFPEGTYHINSANGSGSYFYINNISNLTIEGSGSTIEITGLNYKRHIFEFLNCKNLTIKSLNIDYQETPFSQGQVINTGTGFMDVKIQSGFNPQGKEIRAYAQYDNVTGQQINDNEDFGNTSWTWLDQNNNTIRVAENTHNYAVGSYILLRHAQYDGYSFIIGSGCENAILNNLTIFLAPGYPFNVNSGAKNVSFLNCNIKRKTENFWATATVDGAHLLDARGEILFDNCYFEHMCDDGINLHGYFHSITQSIDNKTIKVQSPQTWYTAPGYLIGDTVEFFNAKTYQSIAKNVISNISNKVSNTMTLQFENELPAFTNGISNYKMANTSIIGSLTVTNSTFKGNRARGILVSASDVLIENCTFDRNMMSAILFEVSNYWNESQPAKNVIIRNNTFNDCGHFRSDIDYGIIDFRASITSTSSVCDIFKNISIKSNTFKNIGVPAVYAKHVANLEISNNTIESSDAGRNLIRYGESQSIVIENNIGATIENMGENCIVESMGNTIELNPVKIFPNPTKEKLTIIFEKQYKNSSANLVDCTGRIIINELLSEIENTIDLSLLTNGIYFLYLNAGNEIISKQKIIKVK